MELKNAKCPKCGEEILPVEKYCGNCGNSLNFSNEQKRSAQPVRKKQLTIGLIAFALILSALAVVVLKKGNPLRGNESDSVPQTTAIDSLKYEDAIRSELYVVLGCDKEPENLLVNAIYQNFSVEIKSVDNQEGNAVAECVFRNRDFASAVKEIEGSSEKITYAEYQALLIDALNRQSVLETFDHLIFREEDGTLAVSFTELQLDHATGGLLTYYNNSYSEGN